MTISPIKQALINRMLEREDAFYYFHQYKLSDKDSAKIQESLNNMRAIIDAL